MAAAEDPLRLPLKEANDGSEGGGDEPIPGNAVVDPFELLDSEMHVVAPLPDVGTEEEGWVADKRDTAAVDDNDVDGDEEETEEDEPIPFPPLLKLLSFDELPWWWFGDDSGTPEIETGGLHKERPIPPPPTDDDWLLGGGGKNGVIRHWGSSGPSDELPPSVTGRQPLLIWLSCLRHLARRFWNQTWNTWKHCKFIEYSTRTEILYHH